MNPSVVKIPVQRTLSLDLKNGRPLCSLSAAMAVLGVREDIVKEMWERGDLEFVFNIASKDAAKLEPRISVSSLVHYQHGYRAPIGYRHRDDDPRLDAIIASLWPHTKPTLRLSEVYDAFCCSSQHALDLMRERSLIGCRNITLQINNGPRQRLSPIVDRASVISFLKSRRLT